MSQGESTCHVPGALPRIPGAARGQAIAGAAGQVKLQEPFGHSQPCELQAGEQVLVGQVRCRVGSEEQRGSCRAGTMRGAHGWMHAPWMEACATRTSCKTPQARPERTAPLVVRQV